MEKERIYIVIYKLRYGLFLYESISIRNYKYFIHIITNRLFLRNNNNIKSSAGMANVSLDKMIGLITVVSQTTRLSA